jgi:hypothetical protein
LKTPERRKGMEQGEIINSLNRDFRAELSAVEIYSAHGEAIQEGDLAIHVSRYFEKALIGQETIFILKSLSD